MMTPDSNPCIVVRNRTFFWCVSVRYGNKALGPKRVFGKRCEAFDLTPDASGRSDFVKERSYLS